MPDLVFTPKGDRIAAERNRRAARSGKLVQIATGVFADPAYGDVKSIVHRRWYQIASYLSPEGIVTDRSGIELQPTKWTDPETGETSEYIFMSAPRSKAIYTLPGLTINVREGAGPLEDDIEYLGARIASPARRFLDNLSPSRSRSGPARTLGQEGVEQALEKYIETHGEVGVNRLRDDARRISQSVGRDKEFRLLDKIIGALLNTKQADLKTDVAVARSLGAPIAEDCLQRLNLLREYLVSQAPFTVEDPNLSFERQQSSLFVEAYFSNYIEGTEFEVSEAQSIVFDGKIPEERPEDGHDVLGTFVKLNESLPKSLALYGPEEFISLVRETHETIMRQRPGIGPGVFKSKSNKAGETSFVSPEKVTGTLLEGFSLVRQAQDPFARAVMAHFLLSDVHPFNDGNGRVSRILMSQELRHNGLCHIVIPTVFREDYLDALRALTRRNNPSILVRSLQFCQQVSSLCSARTLDDTIEKWARTYAFVEDGQFARFSKPHSALSVEWRNGVPAPTSYWDATDGAAGQGFRL